MIEKHTPGGLLYLDDLNPRRVMARGRTDTIDGAVSSTIAVFAPTTQRDDDGREWACEGDAEANARLFLAAPDLLTACLRSLEFCRSVNSLLDGVHSIHCANVANTLRNALAKTKDDPHP